MPSTITHTYIGLDTINKLNNKPKEIINKHINNYKVYCQSMDALYFYRIYFIKKNGIQKLGSEFHHKHAFKAFEYLIKLNKENKNEELFTFISGLITHYNADSIMHPFINYLAFNKDKLKHTDNHFEVETYLDNYFINKKEKVNQKNFKNYKIVFNYTKEDIIKETIDKLFEKIYNAKNIGSKYYQGLDDMAFSFKVFRYDKTGLKKKVYKLIDKNNLKVRRTKYLSYNFDLDNNEHYLNLKHNIWYNVKKKELTSTKSFLDLYDIVTDKGSFIINNLYDYIFNNKEIDLFNLIKNNSYSDGLPLKD